MSFAQPSVLLEGHFLDTIEITTLQRNFEIMIYIFLLNKFLFMFHYEFSDDTGDQAHAGIFKSASRSFGSKYAANRMREEYPTGDRNDADGMDVGHGSGSDVENFSRDIADTDDGVHGGVEAYGSSNEKVDHENENGFDSREKDDVRSIRDGHVPGSKTGSKGMNNFYFA